MTHYYKAMYNEASYVSVFALKASELSTCDVSVLRKGGA